MACAQHHQSEAGANTNRKDVIVKIQRIAVYELNLPYRGARYAMSGGRTASSWATIVVRVDTDQGLSGFGEACPLGCTYLDGSPGTIQAGIREMAEGMLEADPTESAAVNARMDTLLRGNLSAKSPIDIACLDIKGQALGVPVSMLLGGSLHNTMPVFDAISLDEATVMAAHAADMREEGYRHYQLKLGTDPMVDVSRIRAVAREIGDWSFLTCDANGSWTRAEAMRVARATEGLDLYLEQPCPTIEEVADVRSRTSQPIVLDEVVTGVHALLEIWKSRAADAINLKITRVGGLTRAALIRDLAQEMSLEVLIDDPCGADLSAAAKLHLASSTRPGCLIALSMTDTPVRLVGDTIPPVVQGRVASLLSPGLGVSVDQSVLGKPVFSVPA